MDYFSRKSLSKYLMNTIDFKKQDIVAIQNLLKSMRTLQIFIDPHPNLIGILYVLTTRLIL
jgi:hypothetical protein